MRTRHVLPTAIAVTSALVLTACAASGDGGETKSLTVWTIEDVADRVQAQQALMERFTEETGIRVNLVPVAEDQLMTVAATAAASGELPDVIGAVPLTSVYQFAFDGLLDTAATASVVEGLGVDTFSARSLDLTRDGDEQLAVPSDGWAQLLYYRTDLFAAAGLEAPTTYDAIAAAAEALDSDGVAGITLATAPGEGFTQQTLEYIALANGCQLVDDDGELTVGSAECEEALDFTVRLARDYSVEGSQDVGTTRATYFSGKAAMIIWSSFLLDELAGLRNDALPTCAECAADPGFLAQNTGIVSAIKGPGGAEPASYGEIVSWTLMDGAASEAQELVTWMMGEAYVDWLALAPEGKVPTRAGNAEDPTVYADAWQSLEAGVDTKAQLSSIYPAEVLQAVVDAPDGFDRWGVPQGQGQLAGAVSGQFILPGILSDMLNSGLSAQDAAQRAVEEIATLQEDLGL